MNTILNFGILKLLCNIPQQSIIDGNLKFIGIAFVTKSRLKTSSTNGKCILVSTIPNNGTGYDPGNLNLIAFVFRMKMQHNLKIAMLNVASLTKI